MPIVFMLRFGWGLFTTSLFATPLAAAEIYQCRQADGQAVFQQQPCDGQSTQTERIAQDAPTGQYCDQLAEAVQQIGRGYEGAIPEAELRLALKTRYGPAISDKAFALSQQARAIPSADLGAVTRLACESTQPLSSPQAWHLNKQELMLKLDTWQQAFHWPPSWRLTGVKERPSFQFSLRYADFDSGELRIGCISHAHEQRLAGLGGQVLAFWSEHIQPSATASANHPANIGNSSSRDYDSKRELFVAHLHVLDHQNNRAETAAYVAIAPKQICFAALQTATHSNALHLQAHAMVDVLLTKKTLDIPNSH